MIGIDRSPAMLAQARERAAEAGVDARAPRGGHARLRARGAGGAHLLPVPGAARTCRPGPTGGGSSSASPRRCGRAGASRGTRSSSTRMIAASFDGQLRRRARRQDPASRSTIRPDRQPDRHHAYVEQPGRTIATLAVVDQPRRVGRADRRRRPRGRGALRRVRARRRSTKDSGEFVWVARKPA